MGERTWGSELWHRAVPGPTECRVDDRGWPLDVVMVWDGGGRGFDWYDAPSTCVVSRVPVPGVFPAWNRDNDVVAVFSEGRWVSADQRDVLVCLTADARDRWPASAVSLLEGWAEDRPPTWDELIAAEHPDMTWDEIRTWISLGRAASTPDGRGSLFDVPEDWFEKIDPRWGCLLDGRRLLLHGMRAELALDYPAHSREQMASTSGLDYLQALPADDQLLLRFDQFLSNCAGVVGQAADFLGAWGRLLLSRDPAAAIAELEEWDSPGWLDPEDPFRYRREAGHPPGFTEAQRSEIASIEELLAQAVHHVIDGIESVIDSRRPPTQDELQAIHSAIAEAEAAYNTGLWICSLYAE